ncbi:sterol desaturase family protein [Sphingomonas gei]|uniref:Sterol desaturase family protein n=1 Tax=Sphingomonas gei TaxID=1395960 RepID=A0A4V3QYH9_9SPHN|nr:sterol desaturase family protein [Sphingomonas gei]TGX50362.1 sterol desaturase family protein [Sphingomonas gei]
MDGKMISHVTDKLWHFVHNTFIAGWQELMLSFAASILAAALVLVIEARYVGYANSGLKRIFFTPSRSTILDLVYFILYTTGVITLLAIAFSAGIPFFFASALKNALNLDVGPMLPTWIHLPVYLIAADFMAYWQHRLMHRIPALWKIHEFHHSAEEFNTITVFREHPLDRAINVIAMTVPAIVIGVPVVAFPLFMTIYGLIGYVKHSRIPWHGWIGKWVIQSPRDHLIHHSKIQEHHDTNFANNFAIWDHLFGTYYTGSNFKPVLGLEANPFNRRGAIVDTCQTQFRFFKALSESGADIWRKRSARKRSEIRR